jgi:hypothetical protein
VIVANVQDWTRPAAASVATMTGYPANVRPVKVDDKTDSVPPVAFNKQYSSGFAGLHAKTQSVTVSVDAVQRNSEV